MRFRRRFRLQPGGAPVLEIEWSDAVATVRLRDDVLREAPSLPALVAAGPLEVEGRTLTLERRGRGAAASVDVVDAGAFLDGGDRAPWVWPALCLFLALTLPLDVVFGDHMSPAGLVARLLLTALLGRTWQAARALRLLSRPSSLPPSVGVAGTPAAVPGPRP